MSSKIFIFFKTSKEILDLPPDVSILFTFEEAIHLSVDVKLSCLFIPKIDL